MARALAEFLVRRVRGDREDDADAAGRGHADCDGEWSRGRGESRWRGRCWMPGSWPERWASTCGSMLPALLNAHPLETSAECLRATQSFAPRRALNHALAGRIVTGFETGSPSSRG